MRTRTAARRMAAAAGAALALVAGAAGAAESGAVITDLTATRVADGVRVVGKTGFSAPGQKLAADPTGDAAIRQAGMDLSGVQISQLDRQTLGFRWLVADQTPVVSSLPQVVYYNWNLNVTTGSATSSFNLQHINADSYSVATAGSQPGSHVFRLQTCTPNPTTGGQSCSTAATLEGTVGAGYVEAKVPMGTIGARAGSVISAGTQPVNTNVGAGAVWFNGSSATADTIGSWDDYAIGTQTVTLGTASAGTPVDAVEVGVPATLRSNGAFDVTLPAVASGDVVVAQACIADDCARFSTTAP